VVPIERLEFVTARPAQMYPTFADPVHIVYVGEAARFTARAHHLDGASSDVTHEARWTQSAGSSLSIEAPGSVTGRTPGESYITAFLGNRGVAAHVVVLAPGTYLLGVRVIESQSGVRLDGAGVEAASGSGIAPVTTDNPFGYYRVYGVAGPTTIRVTKAAYQTQERTLTVSDHQTFDVNLPWIGSRPDVSGTYSLTVTASDECGTGLGEGALPDEARVRRYAARVGQRGPYVEVTLSGGTLPSSGARINGEFGPDGRVVFNLRWLYDSWDIGGYYPELGEQLSNSTYLAVIGRVEAAVSQGRVAGRLEGSLEVLTSFYHPVRPTPTASCTSGNHQFALAR